MTRMARPALTTTSAICRSEGELLPFSRRRRKRSTRNATLIAIHQPWRRRLGRPRRARGLALVSAALGALVRLGIRRAYTRRSPRARADHPDLAGHRRRSRRRRGSAGSSCPHWVAIPNDRLHCNRVRGPATERATDSGRPGRADHARGAGSRDAGCARGARDRPWAGRAGGTDRAEPGPRRGAGARAGPATGPGTRANPGNAARRVLVPAGDNSRHLAGVVQMHEMTRVL